MAEQARPGPPLLPNLVVAQRVLERMAAAAHAWQADETGEALVGLAEPGVNTNGVPGIYLLDTIAPDDSALRMAFTFQQGDPHQDEVLWWLQENWRLRRQRGDLPPQRDVPLRYLGDWHKQPDGMTRPSRADLRTAQKWLRDPENAMDFLLAPIVTRHSQAAGVAPNRIRIDEHICVDFWYLHRRQRSFQSIVATVYPDAQLPRLAQLAWHLQDPMRLELEITRLQEYGFALSSLVLLDILDHSALDVCVMLGRAGAERLCLVATPPDYPARPPQLRLAPFTALDEEAQLHERFTQLWGAAAPLAAPADWPWHEQRSLAELVEQLERDPELRAQLHASASAPPTQPQQDVP